MSIIKLEKVVKQYGKGNAQVDALKDVNLIIEEGEMVAIMGTSGSGKTTLLNIIGCIDKITKGNYYLFGKNIDTYSNKQLAKIRNENIGFVVQDFALIDRYTVFQNVKIPLVYSNKKIKSKKDKIENILEQLGIIDKKNTLPCNLSGGQKQRVAIARAIINNPNIILADEPTGSLDSKTSSEVMSIFKKINDSRKTIIIVTHDINVAKYCNKIIKIEDGMIVN